MANSTTNQTEICNKQSHAQWLFATVYSIIFTIGLLFNLLALIFFFRFTKIRSQTTVYMKNLACADLLLVISLPLKIYMYSTGRPLDRTICEINGLIFFINMYGSIFFLTCISLDRCVAICFPLKCRVNEFRKKAVWISVGVWVLVVGASMPAYLITKLRKTGGSNNESCTNCFDEHPSYITRPSSVVLSLVIGYGTPLVTMVISSVALLRAVRLSTVAQMDMVDCQKIRNMVLTNVIIFIICFLPYHTILFLFLLNLNVAQVYRIAMVIASWNTVLDPVAYYFTTETFQKTLGMQTLRNPLSSNTDSAETHNRFLTVNTHATSIPRTPPPDKW
ncbi:lysophosphatidic acid receptor 6 [Callorhinchus milii]|nr:lysophosphatidic acid receptor 6 [Callorhinchus milii]|eukprot:gi/632990613/ref/XP_007884247.1/ PREDICTED: lysophosphatidic acid receptor 6-like [Callorhinchus milii]